MSKNKKVILFIVEGITDQSALEPIMKNILKEKDDKIKFRMLHKDITSHKDSKTNNIKKKLGEEINKYLDTYKLKRKDIREVVHLIDTDGAFVPDTNIEEKNEGEIEYTEDKIKVKDISNLKERNKRKTEIIKLLYKTDQICKIIPYKIYYFSRNREHVLNNKEGTITEEEKNVIADEFSEEYENNIEEFYKFMCCSSGDVGDEYEASWEFIMKGTNSLKKYHNFHIYLQLLRTRYDDISKIENVLFDDK